ncbi:hypothetical protein KAOT1_15473 [Kordia algicida OT-1]|uniref:Lipoprotein n=2 Tax=Kordia TaxID=221065 RepID=A9DQ53_9FLAO|nr:hypothetical protein KAOT1_15473 [Kordia algicida OT-1]
MFLFFNKVDIQKLMKKIITLVLIIISFISCEKEAEATRAQETQSKEEYLAKNKLNIPRKGKLEELTPNQKKLVQDWLEFNTVHENMKLINSSTRFAIVEDLEQLAANIDVIEKKKYPKDLDVMQIRSRFLVLKTKALKLQDDATDENTSNDFIEKEIVEMNKVFNSVCYQIVQASQLNIKPEEILGDAMKLKDSTNVDETNALKKEQQARKEFLPKKKATSPKKPFQEVESEEN